MEYIEADFSVDPPGEQTEILIAFLSEIGFSMFEESATGVKAYIEESGFNRELLESLPFIRNQEHHKIQYKISKVPFVNWNEEWEKNFQPVRIGNQVYIRAEYHNPDPAVDFELVIHPNMAFGTGHHATTSLVLEAMLQVNFQGKKVLDMGCGTGILSIMAKKLGADHVTAVDIDPVATENTLHNAARNGFPNIGIITGQMKDTGNETYDVILANINRNIILEDLPLYSDHAVKGGILIVSGFYEQDLKDISAKAQNCGMILSQHKSSENWCMAMFCKKIV